MSGPVLREHPHWAYPGTNSRPTSFDQVGCIRGEASSWRGDFYEPNSGYVRQPRETGIGTCGRRP